MRKVTHSPRETTYSAPYNCKNGNPPAVCHEKGSISSFFHKNSDTALTNPFWGKNGVVIVQLKTSSVLALSTPLSDEISFEQLAAGKQAPISNKLKNFSWKKAVVYISSFKNGSLGAFRLPSSRRCRHHQWRKFLPSIVPLLQTW